MLPATTRPAEWLETGIAAGGAARAYAADLGAGFVRQIDRKGLKVVAGGAAISLLLGLGAGFIELAPIYSALIPRPMVPVPGTSQVVASLSPVTAPAPRRQSAPIAAAMAVDAPTIATGDDPDADSQDASPDEAQAADPDATAADAPSPQAPPPPDYDPD